MGTFWEPFHHFLQKVRGYVVWFSDLERGLSQCNEKIALLDGTVKKKIAP